MLTVISPAKKLDFDTSGKPFDTTRPALLPESRKLNKILREYSSPDLMELMHISSNIAELNVERNHQWKTPFTEKNASPAIMAFKGDVYQSLNAETLNKNDLEFGQKYLRILSGLYGILRPMDLMQAYRLEMGTRLQNPRGKNLYDFWGNAITEKLDEELAGHKSRTLVNLASNEYFKVVKPGILNADIITPAFRERRDGDFKIIGILAKKARGLMSRFIIKNRIDNPDDLKGFDLDGYRFNESLSTDRNWAFTRG